MKILTERDYSGAQEECFGEKTEGQKSSDTVPLMNKNLVFAPVFHRAAMLLTKII
jgi:hypothetical protein